MKPGLLTLMLLWAGCATANDQPPRDPGQGSVTAQDFYFYGCVREYMVAQSIPVFDGSVGYAQEYFDAPHEVLSLLYADAKTHAAGIRKPDYSDTEHGLPAVLVDCQRESRSAKVKKLVKQGMAQFRKREPGRR